MQRKKRQSQGTPFVVFFFFIQKMILFEYRFVCVFVYLFKNVNNTFFNCLSLSRIVCSDSSDMAIATFEIIDPDPDPEPGPKRFQRKLSMN